MPSHTSPSPPASSLRVRAASALLGVDAGREAGKRASEALAVLHGLASSPTTAEDALALLHELQVHQVELDLQAHDLRESRSELEAQLLRAMALFEELPVGCFCIDHHLVIQELNRAGAELLGLERVNASGLHLELVAAPTFGAGLRALMHRCETQGRRVRGALQWPHSDGSQRNYGAEVAQAPSAQGFLVVLTPA